MSDQHDYQGTGKNGQNAGSVDSVTKAQAAFQDGLANGWIVPDGNGGFKAGRQDSGFDAFMSKFVPLVTAAGVGAAFAPALVGALGTVGGGAASGALTGASGAAFTGKNIGKGALTGALGGGLTAGLTPYVQNATGLGNTAASGLTGAGVGAVRGAVTGQGAGMGAASGAISGLAGSNAAKDYAGQIFGNTGGNVALGAAAGGAQGAVSGRGAVGGAVMGAGGAAAGAGFNYLTGGGNSSPPPTSNTGSGSNMPDPYVQYANDPSQSGGYDTSGNGYFNPVTPGQYNDPGYANGSNQSYSGAPSDPTASQGGTGGWGGQLSKLFGPNGLTSGAASGGMGLLGSLMGAGASYAGSSMQNAAARQAAGQYAQNTRFSPYGLSGPGGTTSFKNGVANTTLNSTNQRAYNNFANEGVFADSNLMHAGDSYGGYRGMNAGVVGANNSATAAGQNPLFSNVNGAGYNGLMNTMGNSAAGLTGQAAGMAGGLTQGAQNADMQNQYGMLQARDQQANNRFMSGNLDSEFANGTLASTAGQYQTQGALDALNTRSTNNALTAQNFALQNMGARVGAFNAVGGQGSNDASQFQNLGAQQYGQNFQNNQTGYNRATDAFGRAMGMFNSGNTMANNNAATYSGLLGQANSGMMGYNNMGTANAGMGGQLGYEQGSVNTRAFAPQYDANRVSTNGGFLSGMGQSLGYNPQSYG